MDSRILGYTLLRVVMGINMFMHGAVRLFGDYTGFANGVVKEFSGTFLAEPLLFSVGYGIPILETIIGLGLLVGLFTKTVLVLSGGLMATLVVGMSLLKNWGTVGSQMTYVVIFALLLFALDYNEISLDGLYR